MSKEKAAYQPYNILVTGGAGFIGSHFARLQLEHKDCRVVILDKLTYAGNPDNIVDLMHDKYTSHYKFSLGDITDAAAVAALLKHESIDTIVNFAAESHVDNSIQNASPFLETNINGTVVLLDAARRTRVKRFVQVSTDEVYGSLEKGSASEESMLNPGSPYAASKAAAEHIAKAWHNTFGVPVIMTRGSNNYGPYQYPEKVISLNICRLLDGKTFQIYGEGRQSRNWIYVCDHVAAIDKVMRQGRVGEIYNIGTHDELKNMDLARIICDHMDISHSKIESIKDPRPGHDMRYSIDWYKIRTLDWRPKASFEDGIKKTIEWYQTNKDWITSVKKRIDRFKTSSSLNE